MNVDCESFKGWANAFSLIHSCEQLTGGELRLSTAFLYPDGSNIDIFYLPKREFFDPAYLSDMGQTSAYLADLHVFPHLHSRRSTILRRTCESLQIEDLDGELRLMLPQEQLGGEPSFQKRAGDAIFRLAHACARVADLSFTKKFTLPSGFNRQISSYLNVATNVRYEVGVKIPSKYDKGVPVDFRTAYRGLENLILTVSPQTMAGAHLASGEVFRKWHLLEPQRGSYGFITLLDTDSAPFRDDDLQLLEEKSHVLSYPTQRHDLRELLGESPSDIHA